jgi:glycosyltransferase involved in cell wall biosynthesis
MTTAGPTPPAAPGAPLAPLSIAIVCKDNAGTLPRTLASVRGMPGEIVAVDSGSTDGTLDLLAAAGARIIRSPWLGHVRTKQVALDASAHEWALSLDSDESLDPPLRAAVERVLAGLHAGRHPSGVTGYIVNRKTWYRGRPLNHAWQPEPRLRLVRRACAAWGGLDPHDQLELHTGGAARLDGDLRHDSFPSFAEHLRTQWGHATTMAASLHATGARGSLAALVVSPPAAFFKQAVLKRGFLDGYAGWLAAASTAAAALMKHTALIERSRCAPAYPDAGPDRPAP